MPTLDDDLSAIVQEVLDVCMRHDMNWLDIIFMFGVAARALTNTCPLPPAVSEREALKAYMAGNSSEVITGIKEEQH